MRKNSERAFAQYGSERTAHSSEAATAYVRPECQAFQVHAQQMIATSIKNGIEDLDEDDQSGYFGY